MRLLFVKDNLAWPRAAGHDVHGYSMMQALGRLGHEVSLLTRVPPRPEALDGLELDRCFSFPAPNQLVASTVELSPWQQRFLSYWGIDPNWLPATATAVHEGEPDAVVAIGLDTLPALTAVRGPSRVWYAADEAAWHHLSQFRLLQRNTWGHLRQAIIGGLYERAFASHLEHVWVVSEADRRAMRWVTGSVPVSTVANGVDSNHFRPQETQHVPKSCVFWGSLDFGPNIQALTWFCRHVWPELSTRVAGARFNIYGRNPGPAVQEMVRAPGIALVADLPDLRSEIARQQVVVLPFVSGGGIKNKLLEAASMGKAIVCSPRALGGLRGDAPLLVARSASDWVNEISALWEDPARCRQLGAEARQWVGSCHTWEAAGRSALESLGWDPSFAREMREPAALAAARTE